ncbi:VWA domain-containing protein [Candidatus Woesearchaeota archaeon]|nr:VWA domain-containing protein [Candidatus Woesearchaeota archaeon]
MIEKKLFISVLIIVVLGVALIPKDVSRVNENSVSFCRCIGFSAGQRCLGVSFSCSSYDTMLGSSSDGSQERRPGSSDIVLVIDQSMSMEGHKFEQALEASDSFISSMDDDDMMAIIVFADTARLVNDFSSDKDKLHKSLKSLEVFEQETNYRPPLALADDIFRDIYSKGTTRKLIFISDGKPTDKEGEDAVYLAIEELSKQDVCLYSVGYGKEGTGWEEVLENMADVSQQVTGCGSFYSSDEEWIALREIFEKIYTDTSNVDLQVDLHSPKNGNYDKNDVLVNFSTNIPAECSFRLNSGNIQDISSQSFTVKADYGQNMIKLYCKRRFGEGIKEAKQEFYVTGKPSFFQLLKEMFRKTREIKEPSAEEFTTLLDEIVQQEKLSVTRNIVSKGRGTNIYLVIKNTKPVTLTNVQVKQIIPNRIAGPEDIKSEHPYTLIETTPLVIEFGNDILEPEEIISISYYIDAKISAEELDTILTDIRFDEITPEHVAGIISGGKVSNNAFDIKNSYGANGNGTEGTLHLAPRYSMEDVYVYLKIPKCMAQHLNLVYFKDTNYRVLSEDPLILWHFDEVSDSIDIDYQLGNIVDPRCEEELAVLTLTMEEETSEQTRKKGEGLKMLISFIPVFLIPLLVLFLAIQKRYLRGNEKRKNPLIKYLIVAALLGTLLWFFFPKPSVEGEMYCDCFGVTYKDSCYGTPYACNTPYEFIEEESKSGLGFCPAGSCEGLEAYLKTDPRLMSERGIDLTLLIDQSKSMEDEKMQHAKDAAVSFLSELRKYDRMAVIKFDNTSSLVQQFTTDKASLISSIRNIDIGTKTEYLPALRNTYYNFLENGNTFNRWLVIFISDGEPGDIGKPESIYRFIREMVNDGICVNTIGFGQEITPGSEAEEILKGMAQISKEANDCGTYYYSPKNIETLLSILGRVYEESLPGKARLEIDAKPNSLELMELEEFSVLARINSDVNGLSVPGAFSIEDRRYCTPAAKMVLTLADSAGRIVKRLNFRYDDSSNYYSLRAKGLPIGTYRAVIHAELNSTGSEGCSFTGTLDLGELKIEQFRGFNNCIAEDCDEIKGYLLLNISEQVEHVLITDYAFIPQNISITKGTTVEWKNIGKKPHTVTSGDNYYDGFFNSGPILPGRSFNITFEKGGNFRYFDNLSVRLRGTTTYNASKNITFGQFKLEYKKPIDLALVVDSSASMAGKNLEMVKSASNKLVEMIYPDDRISLIRFSDDARILQDFTHDRELLHRMIENIVPGKSTRYIPAMEKAKESFFDRTEKNDSGRIIIFLSDGIPWDDNKPDSIYKKAKEIIDQGVCIYTVGYGDEMTPGSEGEVLLKDIVSLSQESTECGKYRYAPANNIQLARIFGSIYYDAVGDLKGLDVYPQLSKNVIYDNETVSINAKVRSSFNKNYVPGIINTTLFSICGPPARVSAKLMEKGSNRTIRSLELRFLGDSTGYHGELIKVPEGEYEIIVSATAVCSYGTECGFSGEESIELIVMPSRRYSVNPAFAGAVAFIIVTTGFLLLMSKKR